jgi:hypothetical protein
VPESVLTASPTTARRGTAQRLARVLFVVLLVSLAGRLAFTIWEPPFDGTIRFDDVQDLGGAYWPMNLYVGGPSYAISFVATAVFLALLGRGRGKVLTLAGALLVGLGGIVFSLVITAEVLPFAYAADPAVLPVAEGRALVDVLNDNLDPLLPAIVGGQVAIALGAALGLVGILLGRTAPRWFPWVGLAYIVVFLTLPVTGLGRAVVLVDYVLQLLLLAGIGWCAVARTRTEPQPAG